MSLLSRFLRARAAALLLPVSSSEASLSIAGMASNSVALLTCDPELSHTTSITSSRQMRVI